MAEFRRLGFPHKHDEDWRYTSVHEFLKHSFRQPMSPILQRDATSLATMITHKQMDLPTGQKLVFLDGVLMGLEGLRLPPGVLVLPILEALSTHPETVQPYLNKIMQIRHGFQAQNTAMLQLGLMIYVPANISLPDPILIVNWQTKAQQAIYMRHIIIAESGADVTIFEDYQGEAQIPYYTNTITELYAEPRASIKHYKIQREGNGAYHVGHVAGQLNANSHIDAHVLSIGAHWSRSDTCLRLKGSHAQGQMNGVYALSDNQHMDHHTWVYHDVPDCTSIQDYKGILNGRSRAVFNGQVHVAPHAQKTIARQQNKNLLLSQHSEIDTKPQLDIAADDVQCTHGATVGQLDTEALFYFATRGIPMTEARHYLIQAFVGENLRAMANETLSAWMGTLLNQHLRSHYE
ncbi:MAG TPA: Fe-S cluster assembly protein SufD, partial [Legionellaceae bacterium]|nr:Fe-S cluster assembly protein SufD [Legionellaceae bacterium]